MDGVEETEHTHMELARDHEGELAECLVTQCEQLDSLLQERGEGMCPLEADHDQVGPVLGTVPDLHGSEREVHAVLHTRPPRARLRE